MRKYHIIEEALAAVCSQCMCKDCKSQRLKLPIRKLSCLQEIQQLLTFVIVGGGPTGVEVAAELHDMISEDLKKVYPKLMKYVSIKLVELQDHVLSTYDRAISAYTKTEFERYFVVSLINLPSFTLFHLFVATLYFCKRTYLCI